MTALESNACLARRKSPEDPRRRDSNRKTVFDVLRERVLDEPNEIALASSSRRRWHSKWLNSGSCRWAVS